MATSGNKVRKLLAEDATDVAVPPITHSEFLILLALATEPAHGYRIMQIINDVFSTDTRIGPGTLYRALQRLLALDHIAEVEGNADEIEDERRRPYRLTATGQDVARRELRRLDNLTRLAKAQLGTR